MGKNINSIQELASETLLLPAETLEQLFSHDAYNEEDIHDIRVASRRLRIGLPIFNACFDEKDLKKWLKILKSLTAALGSARDHDVFINFLNDNDVPEEAVCIEKTERDKAYKLAEKKISRVSKNNSLQKIISKINEIDGASGDAYKLGLANIIVRYNAVRSCSYSLDDVEDTDGHHQMRIAVKKFRYTLEVFSPLFDDHLSAEIGALKDLQDTLGKMHDFDVFLEKIPQFIRASASADVEIASLEEPLIDTCRKMRIKLHRKALRAWTKLEINGYFYHLSARFKNSGALNLNAEKIMIVSDIHGNYPMLKASVEDGFCRGAEAILCLGDISGKGDVSACLEYLQENKAVCIHGNYDVKTLEGQWAVRCFGDVASLKVPAETADALGNLPSELRICAGGRTLMMVHDSPDGGKERLHAKTNSKRLAYLGKISDADCILIGHSHLPFIHKVNDTLFVNPGSIGKPKDSDPRPSYALFDAASGDAEIIKLDGDSSEIAARYKILPSVAEAEKGMAEVYWGMEEVLKTAEELNINISHALAVARNASALFCCLTHIHDLQERDLEMLQYAAVLHDAGWLFGRRKHEKNSYKIIKDLELHLNPDEQEIIAAAARYHRGKVPKVKNIQNASEINMQTVLKLSALLRTADEITNNAPIGTQISDCTFSDKRIIIHLTEACSIKFKKDDLFKEVFKHTIEVA